MALRSSLLSLLFLLPFAGCPTSSDTLSHTGAPPNETTPTADTALQEEACISCGVYMTSPTLPRDAYYSLCADSLDPYAELSTCMCGGACASACGDNVCSGGVASEACSACILTLDGGCGSQAGACLADV